MQSLLYVLHNPSPLNYVGCQHMTGAISIQILLTSQERNSHSLCRRSCLSPSNQILICCSYLTCVLGFVHTQKKTDRNLQDKTCSATVPISNLTVLTVLVQYRPPRKEQSLESSYPIIVILRDSPLVFVCNKFPLRLLPTLLCNSNPTLSLPTSLACLSR